MKIFRLFFLFAKIRNVEVKAIRESFRWDSFSLENRFSEKEIPSGQNRRKAVCRSVLLTWHYILSAEFTQTHSFRLFFLAILPVGLILSITINKSKKLSFHFPPRTFTNKFISIVKNSNKPCCFKISRMVTIFLKNTPFRKWTIHATRSSFSVFKNRLHLACGKLSTPYFYGKIITVFQRPGVG